MQPEASSVPPASDPDTATPNTQHSPSQHGLQTHAVVLASSSCHDNAIDPDEVSDLLSRPPSTSDGDGLNRIGQGKSSPTRGAVRNRISEYEQAATPPARRRDGPRFEVIKRQRSPGDTRSPLQELPNDLASVALVSRRFHGLVTGPYAWRSAFAHYFLGPNSIDATFKNGDESDEQHTVASERRSFSRLTALASWRSEYILRTRLLRSLARGKPTQANASSTRAGQGHVDYNTQLFTSINHLHVNFGSGLNKRAPRFIHGAHEVGMATWSDPATCKVDAWGLSDPQQFFQFADRFPGDAQYGLGPGEVVGVPNVMDVSQPYGMIHGEGFPGGMVYFRSTEEMRGRFLLACSAISAPGSGIPRVPAAQEAITAVWIAKCAAIPSLTDGSVGMLAGSSLGVVSSYSLGLTATGGSREQRHSRGEITARWVLSPGVPIIAIAVDNDYSLKRHAENRIWAVVLNALGELFYLTKFPSRPPVDRVATRDDDLCERLAWLAGRSVYWNLVESSRRIARPDPYGTSELDGSYTPRSSWNGMCLGEDQLASETREIESFLQRKPGSFQKTCEAWDMQRRLIVDFANDDGHNAGETAVVIDCGLQEGCSASIRRYMRFRSHDLSDFGSMSTPPLTNRSTNVSRSPSLPGGSSSPALSPLGDMPTESLSDSLSQSGFTGIATPRPLTEEWRLSNYSLHGLRNVQILATALDESTFASQTLTEDPILNFSARSNTSSPTMTPLSSVGTDNKPGDIPGQRARLFAVGTQTGSVLLWDVRAPPPRTGSHVNTIEPVRIIYTDSPQISCLALSSLYLVHGGNDGLVQTWDPLGSSPHPVRTLHSRFASRARRRLAQAQASPQGVGINLFAAGAICLDSDPTVLRGVVSLGTQLRFWSYSSSAADQYKSQKRRLRRAERGSNNGGERFAGVARSNLKDYIASERFELDRDRVLRQKEAERFAGRFGTDLLDGSEEEMMAYAAMLSQETLAQEKMRRASDSSTIISTPASSALHSLSNADNITWSQSSSPRPSASEDTYEHDADMAEAIRMSLEEANCTYDIAIRAAKPKKRKGSSAQPSPAASPSLAGMSKEREMTDLEFALQLSLAEEKSRHEQSLQDEFPALSPGKGKVASGKGKARIE